MHVRTAVLLQCQVLYSLQTALLSKATERVEAYPQLSTECTEEIYPREEEDYRWSSLNSGQEEGNAYTSSELPLQVVQNGC